MAKKKVRWKESSNSEQPHLGSLPAKREIPRSTPSRRSALASLRISSLFGLKFNPRRRVQKAEAAIQIMRTRKGKAEQMFSRAAEPAFFLGRGSSGEQLRLKLLVRS